LEFATKALDKQKSRKKKAKAKMRARLRANLAQLAVNQRPAGEGESVSAAIAEPTATSA
jgi:hypothetical protein